MAYFINKIDKNIHNHYKYHYLDHMTTVIDIRENYWSFAMDLYSINDFKLPINSLVGDLQLPYQKVENISFNLASDQSHAQEAVEYNKQYCRIYNSCFNVDISQNEYLKQDLNNVKLDLELNLYIDPEAAKGAGDDIKQDDLDPLIVETSEQRWNFVLYYTNTHFINQNDVIDNITGYSLPLGNKCVPISRMVQVSSLNLSDVQTPIDNLATLTSSTDFQIIAGKIKFTYWLESEFESQSLEINLVIDHSVKNKITVRLNQNTSFDYINNKVVLDPNGINGFYIPKYSHGYYELELNIVQANAINKFVIKNYFNFNKNQKQAFISIYSKVIKEKDDQWEEVTYDTNV